MKFLTRRRARTYALQAVYSWRLSNNSIEDIERYIVIKQDVQKFNINYFRKLYIGAITYSNELDKLMKPFLLRDLKKIGYIEHSVLYIALFEMTRCKDVPYKVVINEAIELTKIFGSEKSHTFVNRVLDRVFISLFCMQVIIDILKNDVYVFLI